MTDPDRPRGMRRQIVPGAVTMGGVGLGYCVRWAYGLRNSYELAAPQWFDPPTDVLYDIDAKAGGPVPEGDLKLMFRTLLAERFGLVLHREKRLLPAYALVVAKGGPKLQKSTGEGESGFKASGGMYGYLAKKISMAALVEFLDPPTGVSRLVIDSTGLQGTFDFTLDLARYLVDDATNQPILDARGHVDYESALLRALPEQLGLRLEPTRASFDIVVIDHANKVPTPN
jgi:uncharacterized protein (TIGR03435 family)